MLVVTRYVSGLILSRADYSCLSNQRRGKHITSVEFHSLFIYIKHLYKLQVSQRT
jgi:hypothetical protein